ncbi:hypothetical protein [Vibrio crassostreae]|uniref:hypothetical protein n=1 Tax=Vibrio crassostreae TaxID=246167 RepID=UPI001B3154DE|nr:hypothetical protein [Vibrio crassostreae]
MFDKEKTIELLDLIRKQIEENPNMAIIYEVEVEYMLDRISQDDGFAVSDAKDPREESSNVES